MSEPICTKLLRRGGAKSRKRPAFLYNMFDAAKFLKLPYGQFEAIHKAKAGPAYYGARGVPFFDINDLGDFKERRREAERSRAASTRNARKAPNTQGDQPIEGLARQITGSV